MDQEQIRTVLAVDRSGTFTRAAEVLHVTQSTVTARVRQLERELSTVIWDRNTRRLTLTPSGERLMPLLLRAEILFERMADAAVDSDSMRRVVFGSVHSQWSAGIVPALQSWAGKEGVRWRLITGHSRELLEWVRDGSVDVAVTYFPGAERGLKSQLLGEQPLALLGAPHLREKTPMWTSATLANCPLAYVDWGPPFSDWFRAEFPELVPEVQVDQAPLLLDVLRGGGYAGFMPRILARDAILHGQVQVLDYRPTVAMPTRAVFAVSSDRALEYAVVNDLWVLLGSEGPRWVLSESDT